MDAVEAREHLIEVLQHAYSGELAAALAYAGHARSLRGRPEQSEILQIEKDEWRHRECVGAMLRELGAAPDPDLERKLGRIGRTIALLCRVGGWFIPMYGAGRLERPNIREYEDAARYAFEAGETRFVDELLEMAEIEWDHEQYFRAKVRSHFLRHLFPLWAAPPPKTTIRDTFAAWRNEQATPALCSL